MKFLRRISRQQRGDTIVEVLLAITVISMVLGVSYGIANRALATGRSAQERVEALKLAEGQLEALKVITAAHENDPANPDPRNTAAYCLEGTAMTTDTPTSTCRGANKTPSSLYDISILYAGPTAGAQEYYEVIVSWERLNTSVRGEVRMVYRP